MAMDKVLRFRVQGGDKELLSAAAEKAGLNLSLWCRLRLLDCARAELGMSVSQGEVEKVVERLAEVSPGEIADRVDAVAKKLEPVVRRRVAPKPKWKK